MPYTQDAKELDRQLQIAIRASDSSGAAKKAKEALAKGTPDLVRVVLTRLPDFPSKAYFEVLPAFGEIGQAEGTDTLLCEIIRLKEKPHILDIAYVLCRQQGKARPELLNSLLKDGAEAVRIVALHQVVGGSSTRT